MDPLLSLARNLGRAGYPRARRELRQLMRKGRAVNGATFHDGTVRLTLDLDDAGALALLDDGTVVANEEEVLNVAPPRSAGRPVVPNKRRNRTTRWTPDELALVEQAASLAGVGVSEFIVSATVAHARYLLGSRRAVPGGEG